MSFSLCIFFLRDVFEPSVFINQCYFKIKKYSFYLPVLSHLYMKQTYFPFFKRGIASYNSSWLDKKHRTSHLKSYIFNIVNK